jgi:hypothetical protein
MSNGQSKLEHEIERRLGVLPNFLCLAPESPHSDGIGHGTEMVVRLPLPGS